MHVFAPVDIEAFLILLVRDAIPNLASKHHLIAAHVVVHDVLELWHKGLFVNQVEVNILIGGDLNSYVSFDEVNETTLIYCVIEGPLGFIVIVALDLLEEKHFR